VVFAAALPRTSVGKIAKARLRAQLRPASPESPPHRPQEDS
jgi:acyl-coenzyme A synthetase/AMP-(fatty) acid ligase